MLNLLPTYAGEPQFETGHPLPPNPHLLWEGLGWVPHSSFLWRPKSLPKSVPVLLDVGGRSCLWFLGSTWTLARTGWWPQTHGRGWSSSFGLGCSLIFHCRHLTNNFKCQPVKKPCGKQGRVQLHLKWALYLSLWPWRQGEKELLMGSDCFGLKKHRSHCGLRAALVLLLPFMSVWFSFHIHPLPFGWNSGEKGKVNPSHLAYINGSYLLEKSSPLNKWNNLCQKRSTGLCDYKSLWLQKLLAAALV